MTDENKMRRIEDRLPGEPLKWEEPQVADWRPYHSALSRCAELLDNMKDGDPITDVPDFLAAKLKELGAHLASQSQATRAVLDLHNAIMNLPCERTMSHFPFRNELLAYKEGHRDARHAAAELANQSEAAREVTQQAAPECRLCNDTGIVGFPPDQYEACPDCNSPITQQAAKAETAEQAIPLGVSAYRAADGTTQSSYESKGSKA